MSEKHMIRLLRRASKLYGYASTMASCVTEERGTTLFDEFAELAAEYAVEGTKIMSRVNAAINKQNGGQS